MIKCFIVEASHILCWVCFFVHIESDHWWILFKNRKVSAPEKCKKQREMRLSRVRLTLLTLWHTVCYIQIALESGFLFLSLLFFSRVCVELTKTVIHDQSRKTIKFPCRSVIYRWKCFDKRRFLVFGEFTVTPRARHAMPSKVYWT